MKWRFWVVGFASFELVAADRVVVGWRRLMEKDGG